MPDKAIAFGEMENSLGFLIRLAQLKVFDDFFNDPEVADLRPGYLSVLVVLSENPGVRQGVLAKALWIKRANMTKIIRTMERDGLVERSVPQVDKRAVQLWLTLKGQNMMATMKSPFIKHEARLDGALSPEESETLRALLRKFLEK